MNDDIWKEDGETKVKQSGNKAQMRWTVSYSWRFVHLIMNAEVARRLSMEGDKRQRHMTY